jgi:isopentenyl-diphosphate delta-isomerase
LFKRKLELPLLISSMTGGTAEAARINQQLAEGAQAFHIAMGIGSQRIGIEHPELMDTFKVRKYAPDILLFANLGAVQLNYTYTIEHCKAAVDALEADGLILHLNALQEALMEKGNTNFSGLLRKIEKVCKSVGVPVVIKEVGWGISGDNAKRLIEAGAAAIDVAGAGGTSWSEVERHRTQDKSRQAVAAAFRGWGIPTAQALSEIHAELPETIVIASGGIRNGVEAAKCLALGASMVGMASPFLKAVAESSDALHKMLDIISRQIRISMFAVGARNLGELQESRIYRIEGA